MSLTAMLSVNVFQHCLSCQCAWVSDASVKVLDALCVSAGKTDEGRTPIILTDMVHNNRVTEYLPISL
jgi:hypothetical protein